MIFKLATSLRRAFFFMVIFLHLQCSGAQTSTSEAKVAKNVEKSETSKPGSPTNLAIDSGSASGTELSIDDGALSEGTKVSLNRIDQPSEFSKIASSEKASNSEFSTGSSVVEVTAKKDNNDVALNSPMTLAIPYNNISLRLFLAAVERKTNNLCVIHKSLNGNLIVFKNNLLEVDTSAKKVRFRTASIGAFQLIYCGETVPIGFTDAGESGDSAPPPNADKSSFSSYGKELSFNLTIPSQLRNGAEKYCIIVAARQSDSDENSMLVIGASEVSALSHPAQAMTDIDTQAIGDEALTTVNILVQSSTQSCSFAAGDSFTTSLEYETNYIFLSSKKTLNTASANNTFGSGQFSTTKQTLKVGKPVGTSSTIPPELTNSCVSSESKSSIGETVGSIEINSGVIASNASELLMDIPNNSGKGTSDPILVKVGQNCQNSSILDYVSTYKITLKTPASDGKYYLMPTTISLPESVTSKLAILPDKNVCVELYDAGFTTSNVASSDQAKSLSRWTLTDTGIKVYAPWDTTNMSSESIGPIYDTLYHLGSNCINNFPASIAITTNDTSLGN